MIVNAALFDEQVGCLEEVLVKMAEADGKGEWGSVMFVPAGAISMPAQKK